MLKQLREELKRAADGIPMSRPMSIRRTDDEDTLLSCDLPLVTDEEGMACFCARLTELGWRFFRDRDRLMLDKCFWPVCTERGVNPVGEAACCLQLARLHPGGGRDDRLIRMLAKAAEQGQQALEKLCRQIHRGWAEELRLGRCLPEETIPYLIAAIQEVSE